MSCSGVLFESLLQLPISKRFKRGILYKMSEPETKTFQPEALEYYRILAGLQVQTFADLMGVSRATVERWESIKSTMSPRPKRIKKIADLLSIKPDDLYELPDKTEFQDFATKGLKSLMNDCLQSNKIGDKRLAVQIYNTLFPTTAPMEINVDISESQQADADLLDEGDQPEAFKEHAK